MRKYNKNMGIILVGVLIATNTQIVTLSHALEPNTVETKLEINIEEKIPQTSNYQENKIAEVRNAKELSLASKDPNIKVIDIKSDIVLTTFNETYYEIFVKGNGKEIKGNGYTISGKDDIFRGRLLIYTNTKIDNLKFEGMSIQSMTGDSIDLVNKSELNDSRISMNGNVLLENVKINNTSISGNGNLVVNSSKLNHSTIELTSYYAKSGTVKIANSEINGNKGTDIVHSDKKYNSPILSYSGNIELENVKIINPGSHAIYAEGNDEASRKIIIKGTLEIEGAQKEAILLKKADSSNKENPLELYIDGDIKQKGDTYTIKAEKEGIYTKVHYDDSKLEKVTNQRLDAYYDTKNREGNKPQFTVHELVGKDRYQTAVNVSNEGWDRADNVVIVNSNSMVDALSATPFAKSVNAPILLTENNSLNSETKKEISRLNAKNIYVIGGQAAVSSSVTRELRYMNLSIDRIGGNDRYETSLEIAKKLGDVSEIAVVNGLTGLPDAVSIAPVAADKSIPIVLASPNEGTNVFDQYIKDNNIKTSYIIGSKAAISNEISNKLPNPERLGGIDRNETNAVILEKFYTNKELNNIFVAKDGMRKQDDLIDALAVGVLASKVDSPVVIVGNDLNDKQASSLSKKQTKEITQVGGNGNENAFNKLVNMFKN